MKSKFQLLMLVILSVVVITLIILNIFKKQNEIKIGIILPLTGPNAKYGQYMKEALDIAQDEINNQHNGINGNKIKLIFEDDQALPQNAVNVVQKFISDPDIPIIFGPWASSSVLAIAPIVNKAKIPVIAEAQSPKIRDAGDYIFRIQPDSRYYLKTLVPFVKENLNLYRVAILYVNNDYGSDLARVFTEDFEKLGGKIIFSEGFTQNSIDFRSMLIKIKSLKPDGIFIPAYVEAGYIMKQARELNIETQFLGSAPMENPEIVTIAGEASEGAIYAHHFDPDSPDPQVKKFEDEYRIRYGKQVEGYAALAYDGLYIISHIISKVGNDRTAIKDFLYKIQNFPGVTGYTSFDDHGDVIKPIVIRKIINSIFVTIWKEDAPIN